MPYTFSLPSSVSFTSKGLLGYAFGPLNQKEVSHSADVSTSSVEFAKRGIYSLNSSPFIGSAVFERMTAAEMEEFFDKDSEMLAVKSWIREGIQWHVGDPHHSETIDLFGPQDLGDLSLRTLWPWHYSGLEPLNKRRGDWKMRYAAGFQLASTEKL